MFLDTKYSTLILVLWFQGDSGGPLMIRQWTKFVLTGVIAHGAGCGLKDYPGLYTPLHNPAYLTWIKKVAFNPAEPDHC